MKKLLATLSILIALFLAGCGKDAVKQSDDSVLATSVISSIKTIETAYEAKDSDILLNQIDSSEFAPIAANLIFQSAELKLTTKLIKIKGTEVHVNINWYNQWQLTGNKIENGGVSTLVFSSNPVKLIRITGENPFIIPAQRPLQN
ncbi:MAG: hypothetical protein ISR96_08060 [Nitrospira sp.]|nr:hypothetical protein [bacterium]MBL7049451.1 hypothetical protein [Nitrospira sp.]